MSGCSLDTYIGIVGAGVIMVGIVYITMRDFLHRNEDRDRRERWALREKLYPQEMELQRQKDRLAELERTITS